MGMELRRARAMSTGGRRGEGVETGAGAGAQLIVTRRIHPLRRFPDPSVRQIKTVRRFFSSRFRCTGTNAVKLPCVAAAFDPTFFSLGLSATDCLLYTPKALQTISESMLPYTTPPTPTFERVVGLKLALGFLSSSAASKLLDNLSIPTKSCGDFLKAQAGRSTSYYSQQFTAILAHNLQVERFVQTAENIARTIKPSEEKTDWKGEYELRRTRKNWVSLGGEVVKKLQTIEFVTRVKVAFGEEGSLCRYVGSFSEKFLLKSFLALRYS